MNTILFFNQCREIGGTDTFLLSLINAWPSDEDKISVWCNKDHKPKNSDKLAQHIKYLLEHPNEAKELGEKGFYRLQNNFTSLRMARKYYDLI